MYRTTLAWLLGRKSVSKAPARYFRPRLDRLEDRRVLAVIWVDDDGAQRPDADFSSIQEAVNAADPGDTIRVARGTYEEAVNVDKTLTILGAQASRDPARRGAASDSQSSIVEVPAGAIFGFNLAANDIVLRGFTIEDDNDDGAGPVGVVATRATSGHLIANNVIQSTTFGIYLNSDGADETVVRRNLIRNNNQDGSAAGNGIYSDQGLSNVFIAENRFTGHVNASIIFVGGGPLGPSTVQSDIHITRNVIVDDASMIMTNTTDMEINNNVLRRSSGSGIFFGGGVSDVLIKNNVIADGAFTGINMRTDTFGNAPEPNSNIDIINNTITGFGDNGIRLSAGANNVLVRGNLLARNGIDGITLEAAVDNLIERNQLTRNGRDGIRVDAASANNVFNRNRASGNVEHDYHDDSTGTGTAGTANTWRRNRGSTQNRPGLIG